MEDLTRRVADLGGPFAVVVLDHALSVLGAILVLVLGLSLAGWAERWVRRAMARLPHVDRTLGLLLASLARWIIMLVTVLATLAQFGVQTTSVLAVLGAAGLAIGLALQGTLQNVAAGVMLLVLRPFRVGERIEAYAGSTIVAKGRIAELGLFSTEIRTSDDVPLMVPNATLWNASIRNLSRHYDGFHPVTLGLTLPLGTDPANAIAIIERAARAGVSDQEHVAVLITGLDGALRLEVALRCPAGKGPETRSDLALRIMTALSGAGIQLG